MVPMVVVQAIPWRRKEHGKGADPSCQGVLSLEAHRWRCFFQSKGARIVVQGLRSPHLPMLARDAPVLSRIGLMCILQFASMFNLDLWNADCKSACLQGKPDAERPQRIYMRAPQDEISRAAVLEWSANPQMLYEVHAPVHGQANAPRQWFIYVLEMLLSLKWARHSLDPCIFLYKDEEGSVLAVLGIHVDDIVACSLSTNTDILQDVEKSFSWGGAWEKRFRFCWSQDYQA